MPLRRRLAIRLRHRKITDPQRWKTEVAFDTLIATNEWDLATNFDELNERHS